MAYNNLKQKTISGMIWVGIQKFGTLIITFLSNIVLARLLTPDDYGMIGMLAIFIAISNTFIDAGLGSALIQKTTPTQEDYTTVFYWNILFSLILYGILFVCAPLIERFYQDIRGLSLILRVQGVVIIINALTIVQFNQLRKKMNFKVLAKINVISAVFSVLVAIGAALNGFGVWALVIQQISVSTVNVFLLWWYCKWSPKGNMSKESLKELFGFGSYIMFSGILNSVANNMNGLLIGKFFSASTLGYFSQSKKIEDVSSFGILCVVEQVTYPLLVEVKHDHRMMTKVLKKFNNTLLALTMPLMYTIILMAEPIIVTLFSDKWLPSAPILQVLGVAGIFICMQGSNYNAIAAIGRSKTLFDWTVIKRISNFCILLASLLIWGFDGLLWGIVFNAAMIALFNMYLVARYIGYGLSQQFKDMLPIVLISTIPFLVCMIILNMCFPESLWHPYIFKTMVGVGYLVLYMLALYFIPTKVIRGIKYELISRLQHYHQTK